MTGMDVMNLTIALAITVVLFGLGGFGAWAYHRKRRFTDMLSGALRSELLRDDLGVFLSHVVVGGGMYLSGGRTIPVRVTFIHMNSGTADTRVDCETRFVLRSVVASAGLNRRVAVDNAASTAGEIVHRLRLKLTCREPLAEVHAQPTAEHEVTLTPAESQSPELTAVQA